MEATVKGMIVEIDVQLYAEREAIASAQVRSINRLAELLSKRARLLALLSDVTSVGVEASQDKPAEKPSGDSPVASEARRRPTSSSSSSALRLIAAFQGRSFWPLRRRRD
jgi:hypothetical protein